MVSKHTVCAVVSTFLGKMHGSKTSFMVVEKMVAKNGVWE